jgi:GNAT superfamily N-acetyltransferase
VTIRRLQETDRAAVMALLAAAPHYNLYLMGNLVKVGLARDFCEFWGDVADGAVRGVINRYFTGWTLYGRADADWPGLVAVLDEHPVAAQRLQDNPGGVPSVLPLLRQYTATQVEVEELMQLLPADFRPAAAPPGIQVRRAVSDDLPGLITHYADAEQMTRSPAAVERPLRDTRIWIGLDGGTLVSAALTNAEATALAMVGGVYTQLGWRNRGIGQAVVSALCAELIRDGLRPALYWVAPAAGTVYRKLGFRRIGDWRSVHLTRRGDGARVS